jgi:cytochrome c-type biogenesis protein CcmH/NrfG
MIDSEAGERRRKITVTFIAASLLALHLIPLFFTDGLMWGFNHLIFLPLPYILCFIVVGLLAITSLLAPAKTRIESVFEKIANLCFAQAHLWRWAAIALLSAIIFWIFRSPTHFLGDGYFVINNISGELPPIYKWPEIGAIKVIAFVYSILPGYGSGTGELAFSLISVLSGAITVFIFGCLAYELGKDNGIRLWVAALLIISAWTLLFFGYAEHYPILWPLVTAYIYASILYLKGRRNLWIPTLLLCAAVLLHLQILFFLISYPLLLAARGTGKKLYDRFKKITWLTTGLLVIAGCIVFVIRLQNSIEFRLYFVPFFDARPGAPDYSMFSIHHLIDIFNELLLLIPLLPLLIILSWRSIKDSIKDKIDLFLVFFSLGGLIFLVMIDPKIGMGRDWDLFALSGLGVVLYLAKLSIVTIKRFNLSAIGLILISLVLTFPFFITNLSNNTAINYMKWLLDHDIHHSRSGMQELRKYYVGNGELAEADSIANLILNRYPRAALAQQGYALARSGFRDQAMTNAQRLIENDPYAVESYNVRAFVYLKMEEYEKAIADYEESNRLGGYDYGVYFYLGQAYYNAGKHDLMMKSFCRSHALNPTYIPAMDGLAAGYMAQRNFDSSLHYAEKMIRVDSTIASAHLIAGNSAFELGYAEVATGYLTRYLDLAPNGRDRPVALDLLRRLGINR